MKCHNSRTDPLIFPRLAGSLAVCFSALFCLSVSAGETVDIGSGDPGLRIMTAPYKPKACVIYQETPGNPLPGGEGRDSPDETIQVIVDHGFNFQKDEMYERESSSTPLQLYPFAPNAAFSQADGITTNWNVPPFYWQPGNVYTFVNGNLTVLTNVHQAARARYHLSNDEGFLGFIDGKVFFCKIGGKPFKIFWREEGSQQEYCYRMPKWVTMVYGVTKGTTNDVAIPIARRLPRWPWTSIWAPIAVPDVLEISLSRGKPIRTKE